MYKYTLLLDFIASLNLPEVWAKMAAHAVSVENEVILWSAIEHGLDLPHDGTVLDMLKPFEK